MTAGGQVYKPIRLFVLDGNTDEVKKKNSVRLRGKYMRKNLQLRCLALQ